MGQDQMPEKSIRSAIASRELDRRGLVKGVAIGATAAAVGAKATAQDASPMASPAGSPVASPVSGEAVTSITRAEYLAALREAYPLEEAASTGGQIIETNTTDISTLNPTIVSDTYSGLIMGFIFEPLVQYSALDGTIVPGALTDYWEVAADQVTYTFHLNPDAMWHDGTPVTAADCEYTFDAVVAEDSRSPRKGTVDLALASYRAVDDHTFELVSLTPSAVFLDNTANLFEIMPKHIWETVPIADISTDPGALGQDPARVIGSGPFKFVEWVLGQHVRLEANKDYWDQENVPVIDEYVYRVVGDANTAVASLRTGESDLVGVPFGDANPLRESNPELQIIDVDSAAFNFYLTLQDPEQNTMFTDVKVRQALHYALDRELLAQEVYDGFAQAAIGTQPILSPAYDPDRITTKYEYDPEKAISLLEEAGWTDTDGDGIVDKDGVKLSFEAQYAEGTATYETQIPYMQQMWRDIGVEMIPAATPFPTVLDNGNTASFEMMVLGFSWGYDGLQGDMFRTNAAPPSGFNFMRYSNEEYDRLDAEAMAEIDFDRRMDLVVEATNIVNEDAAVGVVCFRKNIYGASPRVHNFHPTPYSGYWWMSHAWVEEV